MASSIALICPLVLLHATTGSRTCVCHCCSAMIAMALGIMVCSKLAEILTDFGSPPCGDVCRAALRLSASDCAKQGSGRLCWLLSSFQANCDDQNQNCCASTIGVTGLLVTVFVGGLVRPRHCYCAGWVGSPCWLRLCCAILLGCRSSVMSLQEVAH